MGVQVIPSRCPADISVLLEVTDREASQWQGTVINGPRSLNGWQDGETLRSTMMFTPL